MKNRESSFNWNLKLEEVFGADRNPKKQSFEEKMDILDGSYPFEKDQNFFETVNVDRYPREISKKEKQGFSSKID